MSSDPAMADGLNWYSYVNNNPIMYSDPTGLSSWITNAVDNDGGQEVLDAEADGDTNVYEWAGEGEAPSGEDLQNRTDEEREADKTSGNWRVIGQTHFDDAHIAPEIAVRNDPNDKGVRGRVFVGSSMDHELNDAYKESFYIGIVKSAFALRSGGKFDLKNRPGRRAYDSHMYDGQYMTWREAGNYLAGMIAGGHGVSWTNFQQQAGYLHQGGMNAVLFTLNWHRITGQVNYDNGRYGEVDYQYYRSQAGYAKGKQLGDPRPRMEQLSHRFERGVG